VTVHKQPAGRRQSISHTDPVIPVWGTDEARELQVRTIARRTGRPIETSRAVADLAFARIDRWGARA